MKSTGNQELRMLGILFLAFLFTYGIGLPILIVGALPLVGWAIHGVLLFPISGPELLRLAYLVLGMTAVTTIVMWLEGKWKGRW